MQKCFVVIGWHDYETKTVLKVFSTKDKAYAFIKICKEYDEKYLPQEPDFTAPDNIWDAYMELKEKWGKNHPSGNDSLYESTYHIVEVDYE